MWSNVVMVDEAVASLDEEVADRVCCHGYICGILFSTKCSLHILLCVLISEICRPINTFPAVAAYRRH